jgi:hypothetical protein
MVQVCLLGSDSLGLSDRQALSAIMGDSAVDNGTAIEAFPGIKDEKEIREPLQHHRPLTLWTLHQSLLR